jgi:hypothetical protein
MAFGTAVIQFNILLISIIFFKLIFIGFTWNDGRWILPNE